MVHEGLPWRGRIGNAGEIGHLPLVPDGEPCPCGNRGCLERYLSLEAYERGGQRRSAAKPGSARRRRCSATPSAPSRTSSTRRPSSSAASRTAACSTISSPPPQPLPNSVVAARATATAPRLMRRATVDRTRVLRGAAALADRRACCRRASACSSPRDERTRTRPDHRRETGGMSGDPLLRLEDITRNFGAIEALRGVSFDGAARRGGGAPRRQRRRQVDAGEDHRRRA